jgi:hypothetical protein
MTQQNPCHNLIANILNEKPTAARRLNNFLPDFLVRRLAAVGFSFN